MIITQEMLDAVSPARHATTERRLDDLHEVLGRQMCFEDVCEIYDECLRRLFDQPQGEGYKHD